MRERRESNKGRAGSRDLPAPRVARKLDGAEAAGAGGMWAWIVMLALSNDLRLQEIARLREAAEADNRALLSRLQREDISDRALPAVYNLAAMLVMPSFYEGFGFPALEAMACGTVPIVSNRSSLPEVVGAVGCQVEPEDTDALAAAMERALTDKVWREAMREAGLERARSCSTRLRKSPRPATVSTAS